MNSEDIIASRYLVLQVESGEARDFIITISRPFENDDGEIVCEIGSEDVIFSGKKQVWGLDEIDCLDYAIQTIDLLISNFSSGKILWPDGSRYARALTDRKMGWVIGKEDTGDIRH